MKTKLNMITILCVVFFWPTTFAQQPSKAQSKNRIEGYSLNVGIPTIGTSKFRLGASLAMKSGLGLSYSRVDYFHRTNMPDDYEGYPPRNVFDSFYFADRVNHHSLRLRKSFNVTPGNANLVMEFGPSLSRATLVQFTPREVECTWGFFGSCTSNYYDHTIPQNVVGASWQISLEIPVVAQFAVEAVLMGNINPIHSFSTYGLNLAFGLFELKK